MAGRRLRTYETAEVELSPSLRALVGGDRVIIYDRARGAFTLTLTEAQVLAKVVGTTDKVDLTKRGSN